MMLLCQMNIERFSIQDVSIIYIKIRLGSPLDFGGALHWTFEALSTGISRRFPLDFQGALHRTFVALSTGLLILGVLIRICIKS